MNEFTKDELLYLCIKLKCDYITMEVKDPFHRALQDKLQFLIDNYCEHKMIKSASVPECVKCGIQV